MFLVVDFHTQGASLFIKGRSDQLCKLEFPLISNNIWDNIAQFRILLPGPHWRPHLVQRHFSMCFLSPTNKMAVVFLALQTLCNQKENKLLFFILNGSKQLLQLLKLKFLSPQWKILINNLYVHCSYSAFLNKTFKLHSYIGSEKYFQRCNHKILLLQSAFAGMRICLKQMWFSWRKLIGLTKCIRVITCQRTQTVLKFYIDILLIFGF